MNKFIYSTHNFSKIDMNYSICIICGILIFNDTKFSFVSNKIKKYMFCDNLTCEEIIIKSIIE